MKSRISKIGKKWNLNEMPLTDEQKDVLEKVGFPMEGKLASAIQRRVKKDMVNKAWIPKQNPSIEDVSYVVVSKNVAENQVNRYEKKQIGREPNPPYLPIYADLSKEEHFKINKTKDYEMIYCDGANIQTELDWLFSKFTAPKPTPNATKTDAKIDTKTEKAPKLSKKDKEAIDAAILAGDSANEIAQATELDLQLIIDYIKSKSNG